MVLNRPSTLPQPKTFPSDSRQARRREQLAWLFIFSLLILLVLGGWLGLRFALPPIPSAWMPIGSLDRYPPRAAPYPIWDAHPFFYLVNDGDGLFAVHPYTHHTTNCLVLWDEFAELFVDPCMGTGYSIYGDYLVSGPPPARGFDRFPVRVDETGQIAVNLENRQAGRTPEELLAFCKHQTPSWNVTIGEFLSDSERFRSQCDYRAFAHQVNDN